MEGFKIEPKPQPVAARQVYPLTLEGDLLERVRTLSKKHNVSIVGLIRQCIRYSLDHLEGK